MSAIDELRQRLDDLRLRAALETDMMYDYIRFESLTFWRPTLAHIWVINDLKSRGNKFTQNEFLRNVGLILSYDATSVRSEYYRLLQLGVYDAKAAEVIKLEHIPVVQKLLLDLLPVNPDNHDPGDRTLAYGWWCSAVHKIASHYHWSEAEIFAIPIVRLINYLTEINIASGVDDYHEYPACPEIEQLQAEIVSLAWQNNP